MRYFLRHVLFAVLMFCSAAASAETAVAAVSEVQHDMTIQGMYLNAHPVVKGVMWILVFCSVITWTIFLFKMVQLRLATAQLRREQLRLNGQNSLAETEQQLSNFGQKSVTAALFGEIADEMQRSQQQCDNAFTERVDYRLERQIQHWVYRIRYGIGTLATVGSVAPFIGLFGTVWGIMNSFIGIVNAKSTNLAVVAPGIAEALFATALGLVAAIPAVMMYNYFTRAVSHYSTLVGNLVAMLRLMVKRDISLDRLGAK